MMNNKSDSNDNLKKGNSCLKSKKFEEAIEYYNKAIASDPSNPYIYCNRGNAYAGLKKYDEAIDDFGKAISLDPNLSETYLNRGKTYANLKKYKKAIKDYNKAISLDPNLSETYLSRGKTYANLKKYEDAIRDYNKAISLDPKLSETYLNRGKTYANLKKYEDAIRDYNKAISLDPKLSDAYFNRGNAYANLKKDKKAIKDFDKAIDSYPNNPNNPTIPVGGIKISDAYFNRRSAYAKLKKCEKCEESENPFNIFSSKVQRVNIPIPEYNFFHKVSDEKGIDSKFIGRENICDRLKTWLKDSKDYTGSYLVTGYRGMGKSSFVGKVLNDVVATPKKWVNYICYITIILTSIVCILYIRPGGDLSSEWDKLIMHYTLLYVTYALFLICFTIIVAYSRLGTQIYALIKESIFLIKIFFHPKAKKALRK